TPRTGGGGLPPAAAPAARPGGRTPPPRWRPTGWAGRLRAASARPPPARPAPRCPPRPARAGGWPTRPRPGGRAASPAGTRRPSPPAPLRSPPAAVSPACLPHPPLPRRSSHQTRRIYAGRCRIRPRLDRSGRRRVSGGPDEERGYFSPSALAPSSRSIFDRPGRSRCLASSYSSARVLGEAALVRVRVRRAAAAPGRARVVPVSLAAAAPAAGLLAAAAPAAGLLA